MFTDIEDGRLWFDGSLSHYPRNLKDLSGIKYVTEITEELEQYNEFSDSPVSVKTTAEIPESSFKYNIPQYDIDLKTYVFEKFDEHVAQKNFSEEEVRTRIKRILTELYNINKYELTDLFKTAIYIVDTMTLNNIVWGVGRGSSVSSYILYLMGIHDIDSVKYELDHKEFFHN